jgi:hypothetical protein
MWLGGTTIDKIEIERLIRKYQTGNGPLPSGNDDEAPSLTIIEGHRHTRKGVIALGVEEIPGRRRSYRGD